MHWDFIAITPDQLRKEIRPILLCGNSLERKAAIERMQIAHLLEFASTLSFLNYPVRVRHTSNQVPDFQLQCGVQRIGVEVTHVKFPDVMHARAIQAELKSTLCVSALYPNTGKTRKKADIIKDGFLIPTMIFPQSPDESERTWLAQFKESLDSKTAILNDGGFIRGDENWLVLLDPMGNCHNLETRRQNVSQVLTQYWKTGWFSRVFLQDYYFRWQTMFLPSGHFETSADPKPPAEILNMTLGIDECDRHYFNM